MYTAASNFTDLITRLIIIIIIHYKRQLYLEYHTQYGKYCSVKLEA